MNIIIKDQQPPAWKNSFFKFIIDLGEVALNKLAAISENTVQIDFGIHTLALPWSRVGFDCFGYIHLFFLVDWLAFFYFW